MKGLAPAGEGMATPGGARPVLLQIEDLRRADHRADPLPPMSIREELAKRALDLVVGVPLTAALLPLGVAIAVAIKLDTPGPVFFTQRRRGRGYRPFRLVKFRTLRDGDADPYEGYEVQNDDVRITRVGRLLRRFSLDELPQLICVMAGPMSLVGARPLDDWESARCLSEHEERFEMRPGLTGLAQVMGRNSLAFGERGDLDVAYVRGWSLRQDIRLLLKTPWVVVAGVGLYPARPATEDDTRWKHAGRGGLR